MRLDKLLVARGYFSTREKAKIAIRLGKVLVSGKPVRKPAKQVSLDASIEVLAEEKPRGYWKLAELDDEWGIFRGGEVVLDIGSSAGGFLLYASEYAAMVYGIEVSAEFEQILRGIEASRGNVRVFIDDAFTFDISRLPEVDVILADLTLPAKHAFKALSRFLPKLKPRGRVLFVAKTGLARPDVDFAGEGLKILRVKDAEDKRERYYLLQKI
jgi:23S rRNA (cytidine1920-2'-O)/16S rRNA (cytidine1409-2'-O)-methyltransferase